MNATDAATGIGGCGNVSNIQDIAVCGLSVVESTLIYFVGAVAIKGGESSTRRPRQWSEGLSFEIDGFQLFDNAECAVVGVCQDPTSIEVAGLPACGRVPFELSECVDEVDHWVIRNLEVGLVLA